MKCQVEGCKGLVANIRRHMRLRHPNTAQEKQIKKKRAYQRKECPKCGLVTMRLDLHLQRIHGLEKGEQLQAAVSSSVCRNANTPAMFALSNCLLDYK